MKIPKIVQLPSGSYFCQLRIDGQSISITDEDPDIVYAKAVAIKAGLIQTKKKPTETTLREAIDGYIAARSNSLSPSTKMGYTIIRNNRFKAIMDKPIMNIKSWQAVVNNEATLCSAKTLKNSWLFVASVLRENSVEVPKVRLPQIVEKEKAFLAPKDIPAFLAAIKGKPCEGVALLALHGLRRSEIWANPEIKDGIIKVRGAVVPDETRKLVAKPTNKNKSSRRDVPVMISRLQELVDNGAQLLTLAPNAILKHINQACLEAELPCIGLHGLRHSFASLAYHLNVPEMYVMQVGGWSDYGTVRKIYTHLAEQDKLASEVSMKDFFKDIANKKANDSPKPYK